MRKLLAAAIILILTGAPVLAGNITTFEDGKPEAVAELKAPKCSDIINITLPAECHIRKATMNVSALLPDQDNPDCPENIQVFLNDTLLWEFNGTDYGALGMQDRFINGTAEWRTDFNRSGGENGTTFRLPKNATVRNATVEVNSTGRGAPEHFVNFTGETVDNYFGCSVSGAGDVNGDGYDDVVVGADGNDAGGVDAGRAYIYYGGPSTDSGADVVLTGVAEDDRFGWSVAGAGDVNGDGYDDVAVGSFWMNKLFLFYGGANMDNTVDLSFNGSNGAISSAGDVNNDGYDDVIIGECLNSPNGRYSGQAFVHFGGASMDNISDVVFNGAAPGDYFGIQVSGAGDVNGDGYDDVMVGASYSDTGVQSPGAGRAYIFFGGTDMDNAEDVVLTGAARYDYFGTSVSGVGDMNGDGYDDVIVGAWETGGSGTGRAEIYFGGANMDNIADMVLRGENPYDSFGDCVSGAGDMNGDGYDDVVVGAYGNDEGGTLAGKAYVFYGGEVVNNIPDAFFTGAADSDRFGDSVSGAGDVDNDGCGDVIVGAKFFDAPATDMGRAYVYKSYAGIKQGSVSVGAISVSASPTYLNGTNMSRDFGPELHWLVQNSTFSGSDKYGNRYVDVPIRVFGKSEGNMTLGSLRIAYDVETAILDFAAPLNRYIGDHKAEMDAGGNLSVPLKVVSQTPGRLGLEDLDINTDLAPEPIKPIPDAELAEDSLETELLDLYEYFKDDYDLQSQLRCNIESATNSSLVRVIVVDNRFISADASYGSANDNWTGEVEVVVEVADQWGSRRLSNAFRIIVTNVNDAPVITSQPPTTAIAGEEYLYGMAAMDGDNDTLTYDLTKEPGGMTVNASTGLVRWVPSKGGKYAVTVTVSDGELSASQSFGITVPNRSPRVTNTTVPMAYVSESYAYSIPVVDDDSDKLVFSLLTDITGMRVDSSSGNLTWTPVQTGNFSISVSVSDGTDTLYHDFIINVTQRNRAPKFSGSPRTYATVGLPYLYDADATDPDNDPLTFAAVEIPAGMTFDNATGLMTWKPAAAGNYTVKLKVLDGKGGEGAQAFTIVVKERVKARVEFTAPTEGQKVKGRLAVTGKAVKGSDDVATVQIRIDAGDWADATGNTSWSFTMDTTKLKNGKHTLQARAYDGMNYSEIANRTITVDNQKAAGKGFIPGFAGIVMPMAVAAAFALLVWRRKAGR